MVLLAVLFLAADVSTACTGYWFVAAAVVTYLIAAAIVHKNKFFCYFGIFFTFCIYCAFMTAQSENSSMIDMYNKTRAVITGTVSRINNTGYGKSITLKECEIKTEYGNSHENVIVYVNNDEIFIKEGFVIEVNGSIRKFEKARNEGMFDAYTYYKSNGIAYRCEAGKIVVTGQKNSIEYIMPEIKNKINNIYEKITDNETKGFLNAVILGDKSEIDDEMYELYRNNGIAHILAISGVKTLKLDIPLVPETRINWAFVPLHIAIIYILKLCLDEEIIPRCRFPCSRGYLIKCINWQKKQ